MRKLRGKLSLITALGLLATALTIGPAGLPVAEASSHREAPLIAGDPNADNTDLYVFVHPNAPNSVTIIANYIPLEEPAGGPNFYKFDDTVLYEIKIDNDGDAVEDITYQFRFTTEAENPNTFLYNTGPITSLRNDPNWNVEQTFSLTQVREGGTSTVLETNGATPPVNVGPRSTPNYPALAAAAAQTFSTPNGPGRAFAGQRDENFIVDLGSIFDLFGLRENFNTAHAIPLPNEPGHGNTDGFNVHTLALQVPIASVTANGTRPTQLSDPNAVIGVWATASRQSMKILNTDGSVTTSGDFVQVSRLANPLVNEVVIPLGTTRPGVVAGTKDRFNASRPSNDAQFLGFVQDPEPARLIRDLYKIDVPPAPRQDLVDVFLRGLAGLNRPANVVPSEQMRINLAVPPTPLGSRNRLGLLAGQMDGFPNGRRLEDDVVDIELRVLAGVLVPGFDKAPNNQLGDGVNTNDRPLLTTFPYIGTPVSGYDSPHFIRRPGGDTNMASPAGDGLPDQDSVKTSGTPSAVADQDKKRGPTSR